MAAPPVPDDDDPWSTPAARAERAVQAHLFRHQLGFMLGILLGFVAAFAGGLSLVLSALLFGAAAICWALSGLFAIAGKRHMFGVVGPMGGGNARVRASGHAPVGSAIVGILLLLLSLGLLNVAVHVAAAAFAHPPAPAHDTR
jgi:uncharacterized membrane protein